MDMTRKVVVLLAAAMLCGGPVLTGCAPRVGGNDYAVSGAQSSYDVQYGTVLAVRNVVINNDDSAATAGGTVAGGALGGVLGSMVGGGTGRVLASVAGAAVGAGLGYAAGNAAGTQTGVEVEIQLDNGRIISVVQGADISFAPDQRVKVLRGSGTTRVVPL